MSLQAHGNALPEGYRLREYRIGRVLGQGGFGITYLAMDTSLERQVAIKEYLPKDFAVREDSATVRPFTEDRKKLFEWGLQRFIEEARTLAKFQHPNIVRVYTVFELHGTAYMAMQFEQGEGLDKLYRENRGNAEADLLRIALPLLDGLECIHQAGFIHRDIKPANIYVRLDGSPVLLDFGSARMAIGGETRTLTSLVTPGFAPYEQYHNDTGKQGPWTDIYGLGATLYAGLNHGRGPLDAIARGNARMEGKADPMDSAAALGQGRYSDAWLQAIDAALQFMAADRPQSIRQWRALFPGMATAPDSTPLYRPAADQETLPATGFAAKPVPTPKLQQKSQPKADAVVPPHASAPPRTARRVALLLVLALAAGLLWWHQQGPDRLFTSLNNPAQQAPQEAQHQRTAKEAARLQAEIQAQARADRLANLVRDQEVGRLLAAADQDIKALRLTSPAGNNALDKVQSALKLNPDSVPAGAGLARIVGKYLALAESSIAASDFAKAVTRIAKAAAISPRDPALELARERLQSARAKADRAQREQLAQQLAQQRAKQQTRKRAEDAVRLAEEKRKAGERRQAAEAARQTRQRAATEEANRLAQHNASGTVFRDTLRDGSKGPEMVVVPAGSFRMGDLQGGGDSDEKPVHNVRIARPFAMGKYEVTFAEYDRFVQAKGRTLPSDSGLGRGKRPVINVSWDDATAYARWLSKQTGKRYRLPSEAEWEYAARAGSETKYPWGNAVAHNRANCDGCGSRWDNHRIAPVGSFAANSWGVYDTVGNVSEWTQDCYKSTYTGAPGDGSASTQGNCARRVCRGGSWVEIPRNVRSAFRNRNSTDYRYFYLGFRLAQDI